MAQSWPLCYCPPSMLHELIPYILIGFFAQMVDGALGMAYGTLSTAVLLALGVPPVTVSASVHSAQFFTAGLSGTAHALMRNIDWKLCAALAFTGASGGLLGAMFLVSVDASFVRPWISAYLLFLGLFIISRLFRKDANDASRTKIRIGIFAPVLGFIGGLLDAIGGGWGPMVTSNLIARGEPPRKVIGSVNLAEFFVKTSIAATLFATVGLTFHTVVAGLLIGGVLAAPLGAYVLRLVKPELLIGMVGGLIVLLSSYQLAKAFL